MTSGAKQITSIDDLEPDPQNANKHSQRGMGFMETSLRECGYGDSMTVDRNGRVISGNGRLEVLADIKMLDAIVVQSDGTRPIVHQRVDLDLETDPKAKRLGILQNRVGEVNLTWDAQTLGELVAEGVEIGDLWSNDELTELLQQVPTFDPVGIEEQGRLDEKAQVECPHCGEKFTPA